MTPIMPNSSARAEAKATRRGEARGQVRLMGIIFNGIRSVALLFLLTESKIRQEARYWASADLDERGNATSVIGFD